MALYDPPGAPSPWRGDRGRPWRGSRGDTPQNRQPDTARFGVATVHPDRTLESPLVARRSWRDTRHPQHSTATFVHTCTVLSSQHTLTHTCAQQGSQGFRPHNRDVRSPPHDLCSMHLGQKGQSSVNQRKTRSSTPLVSQSTKHHVFNV